MVLWTCQELTKKPKAHWASVIIVPFWSHSKPHTKTQLEWPKRLVQLDNQLQGEKHTEFLKENKIVCMWVLDTLLFSL